MNFRGLRCGGDLDVPLTDIGCGQTFLLAKQIKQMDLGLDRIRCGTLMRLRQTALIISGVLGGLPIDIDAALNKRAIGEWNQRPIAETEHLIAQKVTPEGGESEEEFGARISTALEALSNPSAGHPLVVSSQSGRSWLLSVSING